MPLATPKKAPPPLDESQPQSPKVEMPVEAVAAQSVDSGPKTAMRSTDRRESRDGPRVQFGPPRSGRPAAESGSAHSAKPMGSPKPAVLKYEDATSPTLKPFPAFAEHLGDPAESFRDAGAADSNDSSANNSATETGLEAKIRARAGMKSPKYIPSDKFEATEPAGMQMAKVASGHKLKRPESYKKHPDVHKEYVRLNERISFHYGGSPKKTQGGAGQGGDGGAHVDDNLSETGSLESSMVGDAEYKARRKSLVQRIPLWIQVCTLMLIPVLFLAIYLGITFNEALANDKFLRDMSIPMQDIFDCEKVLAVERGTSSRYVEAATPSEKAFRAPIMAAARLKVDAACSDTLLLEVQQSKYTVLSQTYLETLRTSISTYKLLRYQVDNDALAGIDCRERYRRVISNVVNGFTAIAKESAQTRRILQLKDLRGSVNRMGMCRAIGVVLVRNQNDGVFIEGNQIEFVRSCQQAFKRFYEDFEFEADEEARYQASIWNNHPTARFVTQGIANLSVQYKGGITVMSEDDWFNNVTAALDVLDTMSENLLSTLREGKELRSAAVAEGLKLSLSVFVAVLGTLFISKAQQKASAQVDFALSRTKAMSRAVQAFIPRSFLKLMAVDSILHLERGDQTEVPITMLWCDIRNFTGISTPMSNEQLFDWLQAHLTRMTRTTEKHKGFVDKFVMDAVASIFLTPVDAVHCAVKMQTVTDALSSELHAHNDDIQVRVGIGIHHATVGVGVLGNDKHFSCSIVSNDINVPEQLDELTKHYSARILVSHTVMELLPDGAFEFRRLGRVRLYESSAREYMIFDIFQADPLPMKQYKHESMELWDRVVRAQEEERYADIPELVAQLEVIAHKHEVHDLALKVKLNARLPYDPFSFD